MHESYGNVGGYLADKYRVAHEKNSRDTTPIRCKSLIATGLYPVDVANQVVWLIVGSTPTLLAFYLLTLAGCHI